MFEANQTNCLKINRKDEITRQIVALVQDHKECEQHLEELYGEVAELSRFMSEFNSNLKEMESNLTSILQTAVSVNQTSAALILSAQTLKAAVSHLRLKV